MSSLLPALVSAGSPDTPPAPSNVGSATLDLRIAAVFVIFVSSLLGSMTPLFLRTFQRGSTSHVALLIRAFSAGVILALALVHILPDGYGDMDGLNLGTLVGYTSVNSSYPIGGVVALFGVMMIIMMENFTHALSRARACSHSGANHSNHGHTHGRAATTAMSHSPGSNSTVLDVDVKPCGSHDDLDKETSTMAMALGMPAGTNSSAAGDDVDHVHGCVSLRAASASAWFRLPSKDLTGDDEMRRFQVVALVMEMGCVFHSVIIGLTLGVNVDSISTARALMIALVFHQGLEGLSLGSVIARAGFRLSKSITMSCLYSITTPTGIAIGIAIASTYNPESLTAFAVQGTLNCISGGLLLYIGLVQLIAEDFSREEMLAVGNWGLRLAVYSLLMLGGSIMCIIAIWA